MRQADRLVFAQALNLIAATTTEAGLEVRSRLDPNVYEKGRKITNAEMDALAIEQHDFHGEWNYTFNPR